MITTDHQAEFSYAFVRAVAASAGCSISQPTPDRKSVDFTISSEEFRCPKLDIQVKSTKNFSRRGKVFSYPLKSKNYLDLIADVTTPRILIVVTLPANPTDWLMLSDHNLQLRHCAYWRSLKGLSKRANVETVNVTIIRDNVFDVKNLSNIMKKISQGAEL